MTKELLSTEKILALMEHSNLALLSKLEIFDTIDSTNSYLLSQAKSANSGWVCLAEQQTKGRGRLGRTWHSPHGMNLYCSLIWRFSNHHDISNLAIAIAVMVANAIKEYGINNGIQLKWPNDVMFSNRKLAGILLERSNNAVVIGIGVNLNFSDPAEKNWISLSEIIQKSINRNQFAALLLDELFSKISVFQRQGLSPFLSDWRARDYLIGKNITVHAADTTLSGIMQGINDAGELIMQDQQGKRFLFRYGEVSVRV